MPDSGWAGIVLAFLLSFAITALLLEIGRLAARIAKRKGGK